MRAVGLANGKNPIAIVVPCHRVIGSDGSLTGFGGGLERKRWLLEHEARHTSVDLFQYAGLDSDGLVEARERAAPSAGSPAKASRGLA
jgi:hypothetical protein